jgi:hypothetical protein
MDSQVIFSLFNLSLTYVDVPKMRLAMMEEQSVTLDYFRLSLLHKWLKNIATI